jgi:hypothetical protein
MDDFEQIPQVVAAAISRVGDDLTFSFPEVLGVIDLCSANAIAVLGVEMLFVKDGAYNACGCSDYHIGEKSKWPLVDESNWPEYVKWNNALARESVLRYPLGDDHVYVLNTASWREFCHIQAVKNRL